MYDEPNISFWDEFEKYIEYSASLRESLNVSTLNPFFVCFTSWTIELVLFETVKLPLVLNLWYILKQ